jgi:hypothetical protein
MSGSAFFSVQYIRARFLPQYCIWNRWKSNVDCCLLTAEINGANVFCFLSSLPLLPLATTAVFGSSLSFLYSKLTLVRRCGLAYQYDGEVSWEPKSVSLSVTKYVHIKSTTVYAPRRNWDSPNPFLASECSPPPRNRGEGAH